MEAKQAQFYDFGSFRVDRRDRQLLFNGTAVPLTPKAFDLLLLLIEGGNRLVEKDDLMKALWPDTFVVDSSLTFNISTLRKTLAEYDSGHQYIETAPRRGYRFVADVTTTSVDEPGRDQPRGEIKTIAILPLRSFIPDADYAYLGLAMADVLITKLGNIKHLLVRPTSAVVRYDQTEQDLAKVAAELGVDSILEGSIRSRDDTIRVTAQLVDVRTQATVWTGKFDEKLTDLFAVEDAIAEKLTSALMLTLDSDEASRLARRPTTSADGYHAYLKGRYYWNKQTAADLQKAVEQFEQAIAIDPNYALAYAGLADAYNMIATWGGVSPTVMLPRAKELALRAIAIDGSLAEARTPLGAIKAAYDWDWTGGEAEFKRAIELSPGYANTYLAYAMVCLAPQRRLDEAIAEIERAQKLDPLSLFINASAGMLLSYAGHDTEAIEQFRKAIEMEPNFFVSHWGMGYAQEQTGAHDKALESYTLARMLSGNNSATTKSLGHLYAVLGKKDEARSLLDELIEASRTRYISPYDVAGIYAGLGDKDNALTSLEAAVEDHSGALIWLNIDNTFNTLRHEPRFRKIIERMNL